MKVTKNGLNFWLQGHKLPNFFFDLYKIPIMNISTTTHWNSEKKFLLIKSTLFQNCIQGCYINLWFFVMKNFQNEKLFWLIYKKFPNYFEGKFLLDWNFVWKLRNYFQIFLFNAFFSIRKFPLAIWILV